MTLVMLSMKLLMTNFWSKGPKTLVPTVPPAAGLVALVVMLPMPPKVRLGMRFPVLASGNRSGVLMEVAARVARSSAGAMSTPPRPAP